MMLDPFHDTTLNVVGLPDDYSGRSLIYDIRKQVTLSRPSPIASTDNWDCHVAIAPTLTKWDDGGLTETTGSALIKSNGGFWNRLDVDTTGGTAPAFPSYWPDNCPVVVNMAGSGQATFTPGATDNAAYWSGIDILSGLELEPSTKLRVIGLAFEVHNTTAAIDRQGLVTCYRTGQEVSEYLLNLRRDGGSALGAFPCKVRNAPPSSVAYANMLDGVSWKAEDGALVVSPITFDKNYPTSYNSEMPLNACATESDGDVQVFAPSGLFTVTTINNLHGCASLEIPTSISGAYFTGLSPETTLALSVRAFVEVFPRYDDANFGLARPSPVFDPECGPVVALIQRAMLPGYPVGMNAKGDFFAGVVDKLKTAYRFGKLGLNVAADLTGDPRLKAAKAGLSATESLAKDVKLIAKEVKHQTSSKKKA